MWSMMNVPSVVVSRGRHRVSVMGCHSAIIAQRSLSRRNMSSSINSDSLNCGVLLDIDGVLLRGAITASLTSSLSSSS